MDHPYHSHEAAQSTFDEHRETTTFSFESELPTGPAVLSIYYDGILNDKMSGFYRSSYKDAEGNAKVMGVTQFEATEARRAFPCWDEPSAKATFSIKLVVPVELEALSNMPVEQLTQVEPEEKTVHFEKTPVMSTYVSYRQEFMFREVYQPKRLHDMTAIDKVRTITFLHVISSSPGPLASSNMSSLRPRSSRIP